MGMAVLGFIRSKTGHAKQEMRLTKRDPRFAATMFSPFVQTYDM